MKKVLLLTMLSAFAANTFAANSVDLKVKGVLGLSSCTPSIDNGATVDYGRINLAGLSPSTTNQLGNKNFNLTITCDSEMAVAFTAADGRSATKKALVISKGTSNNVDLGVGATAYQFGLGDTADAVHIGAYSITTQTSAAPVTIDGVAGNMLLTPTATGTATSTWNKVSTGSYSIKSDGVDMWSVGAADTTSPKAFKVAVFPLRVSAAIQDTTTLAITDDTDLDGLATFTLKYL